MPEKKNGKKTLWLYAVVLFTSAFIVLLLTAYSQIKFNKNIDEYKYRISFEEKQKNNFQLNLNTAIVENNKLKEEMKALKDENAKIQAEIDNQKAALEKAAADNKNDKYEALMTAIWLYEEGKVKDCAEMLYRLSYNQDIIGMQGMKIYNIMKDKTYKPAAEQFFLDGYREYQNKHYPSAIKAFSWSLNLAPDQYFSDDCLYFSAYAEYNSGNNINALDYIKTLLERYPGSSYTVVAKELRNNIQGKK